MIVASERAALARHEAEPSAAAQKAEISARLAVSSKKRADLAVEYAGECFKQVELQKKLTKLGLDLLHAQSNLIALESNLNERQAQLNAAEKQFKQGPCALRWWQSSTADMSSPVAAEVEKLKNKGQAEYKHASDSLQEASPEAKEEYDARRISCKATLAELEERLLEEQATLNSLAKVSANVINTYEKRLQKARHTFCPADVYSRGIQIAHMEKQIAKGEAQEAKLAGKVNKIGVRHSSP